MVRACPKCGVKTKQSFECPACGIIFAKYAYDVATVSNHQIRDPRVPEDQTILPQWLVLLMPVLAFGLAPLFRAIMPKVCWVFSMWIHEFGHAFAGWWGGVAATPFLGWTNFAADRAWYVTLCFTFLLVVLGYKCWQKKSYFLVFSFFLMFGLQVYFRFALSKDELNFMFSYLGVGGEFWISAWLVVAYHHTFPEKTHWAHLRYIALFVGAVVFYGAFDLWLDVAGKRADIPWGSLWGGEDHGDMNSLLFEHGWSGNRMTRSYLQLGYVCVVVMLIHYVTLVVRAFWIKNKSS